MGRLWYDRVSKAGILRVIRRFSQGEHYDMSLDPYAFCPCGSGNKIKFCCCADVTSDLDRIIRTYEGEQRLACLKQVDNLIRGGKDRAAFLSIKARLEFELDELDKAEETVKVFLDKYPENPVAFGQSATLEAMRGTETDGVETLQRALELCFGKIPADLLDALDAVATRLLSDGKVIAARSHWMLLAKFNDPTGEKIPEIVTELISSTSIPLLLRTGLFDFPASEEAPWIEQFTEAMVDVSVGVWLSAADKLTEMGKRFPQEPAIWNQLANMRCALGQNEAAIAALRKFAAIKRVPLESAVEAEALAQMLVPDTGEKIDLHRAVFPVRDTEALVEHLLSDQRAARLPSDVRPTSDEDDDVPPPRACFEILDRPKLTTISDAADKDLPQVLGELYVYGKETDRDARAEFILPALGSLNERKAELLERLGDYLNSEESNDTVGEVPGMAAQLDARRRFPDDAPADQLEQLNAKIHVETILQRWPQIAMKVLDGKTPAQAVTIPALRKRLLAAVLRLELALEQIPREFDPNRMRAKLGLPPYESIDPWTEDISKLPVWRLARVDTVKISDEQLAGAYRKAILYGATRALRKLGEELLARESLREEFPIELICATISRAAYTTREAIDYFDRARQNAVSQGRSPAMWMIAQLPLRFRRGEVDEFEKLLEEIRLRYLDQPDVAERLQQVLTQLGFVPTAEQSDAAVNSDLGEPVASTESQPSASSEIWTPGSASPARRGGEKSGLWVPPGSE